MRRRVLAMIGLCGMTRSPAGTGQPAALYAKTGLPHDGRGGGAIGGRMARGFLLVMDSFGIGSAADAEPGDRGADTLGHIAAAPPLRLPHLERCALGVAAQASSGSLPAGFAAAPALDAAWGLAVEHSRGQGTPSGHLGMMGVSVIAHW